MRDGRWARLALEAGFLVAVAAVLTVSHLRPAWIVLSMLLAWAIVALLEWVTWRERPHWASGLPPRYYVPEQPLPPRPPSVELPVFTTYPRPAPREPEAATWIATPAMREEVLGWPAPAASEEPQTTVEELPEELLAEAAAAADGERSLEELEAGWPVLVPEHDPWLGAGTPAEPEAAEVEPEAAEVEPEAAEAEPEPGPVAAPRSRPARHHLDPFAAADARRRPWQRPDDADVVELATEPPRVELSPSGGAGR